MNDEGTVVVGAFVLLTRPHTVCSFPSWDEEILMPTNGIKDSFKHDPQNPEGCKRKDCEDPVHGGGFLGPYPTLRT